MANKMEKWLTHEFSSGGYTGEDFNKFARELKQEIKSQFGKAELELFLFTKGHYYISGFVFNPKTEKYAYFSISDVRYSRNEWWSNVLIRTAKNAKDYTGGFNQYCPLMALGKATEHITGTN